MRTVNKYWFFIILILGKDSFQTLRFITDNERMNLFLLKTFYFLLVNFLSFHSYLIDKIQTEFRISRLVLWFKWHVMMSLLLTSVAYLRINDFSLLIDGIFLMFYEADERYYCLDTNSNTHLHNNHPSWYNSSYLHIRMKVHTYIHTSTYKMLAIT